MASHHTRGPRPHATWPLRWVVAVFAGVTAAWALLAADVAAREGWAQVSLSQHLDVAFLMHAAYGALLGLAAAAVASIDHVFIGSLRRHLPRAATALYAGAWATLAAAASCSTAFHLFDSQRLEATAAAKWGPWILIAIAATAGAAVTIARSLKSTRARWVLSFATLALSVFLMRIDLTVLVALYARLHAVVEAIAMLSWLLGMMGLAHLLLGRWPQLRFVAGATSGVALATLLLTFGQTSRDRILQQLRHTWQEPVYVGRVLARLDRLDAWTNGVSDADDGTSRGIQRLVQQYDIDSTSRSPSWDASSRRAAEGAPLSNLRARMGKPNIIVFYVDSLRYDALDPSVMPNAARFAAEGIDFKKTYSPASDTAMVLPCLIQGTYDIPGVADSDVLSLARRTGTKTVLAAPRSAREFLAKVIPDFRFDEDLVVPDYNPGESVWGYGAKEPSADALTDAALTWLRARGPDRFLLWLFNFDVHNWNYLDRAYLEERTNALSIPDDGALPWRYRVAAGGVDAALGRLLAGLDELHMRDDTIVVFVSDHGEALGEYRFWMHSTYLWEPLVHVPLALRIPGVPPTRVDDMVSLIDFAPTLARTLDPGRDMQGYHGEDLLGHLLEHLPARRFPLLMRAATKDTLTRVGVIDPSLPYKLVVPLDSGIPQLYDLRAANPEDAEHAADRPAETARLLSALVRSPVFPRAQEPQRGKRPR